MQKTARGAALLALFFVPTLAFGAGFAKQSLFLSKPSVTEGDTVLIHAVVDNNTQTKFSGTLFLTEGGASIGSVPVSLGAEESAVASVSWKPMAGSHSVTAELKTTTETVEKQSATFVVAEKPKPVTATSTSAPQSAAAVESSAAIQQQIHNLSPQAGSAVAPIFVLIDGGRSAAADVLDNQIARTKTTLGAGAGTPGQVLGAEDVKNAGKNPMGAFWYILQTLYLYLLTIVRFVIGNVGIFYPLLAIIILFVLWRTFRRFRRSAY